MVELVDDHVALNDDEAYSRCMVSVTTEGIQEPEDPYAELAVVEAEFTVVSQTLASLTERVQVLKSRINELDSPFVRLLPSEIMSEIFLFCIPPFELPSDDSPIQTTGTSISLRLGAVCLSWRKTAWGTPNLWSTVTLHLTSAVKLDSRVHLLDEWLSRSGHLPLSIRLSASEDVSWAGANSEDMMKSIAKYSSRWRNIDIRIPSLCYHHLPSCDNEQSFPLLHSIVLRPPGGQGDRVHRINLSIAPSLRHLSLSCLYLRSITFHWEVITHLDLESFYVDESLEMLRQTTNLVDLNLRRVLGGDDRHDLPKEPIVLPALERMIILNDKGTDMPLFFDSITTPSLRTLDYTGEGLISIASGELIALITRSGCPLQELSISKASIREEALISLMAIVPTLVKLTLVMPAVPSMQQLPLTDKVLRLCDPEHARKNNVACQLPMLESLTYSGGNGFKWSTMVKLLNSRFPMTEGSHSSDVEADRFSGEHKRNSIINPATTDCTAAPEDPHAHDIPDASSSTSSSSSSTPSPGSPTLSASSPPSSSPPSPPPQTSVSRITFVSVTHKTFSRNPSLRFGTADREAIQLLRKRGATITHRVVLLEGGGNVVDDQDWGDDAAVGVEPGADTEVEDEGQEHVDGPPSLVAQMQAMAALVGGGVVAP
ncbi:hypothetical protein M413DRAFT_440662 [Hebeloma cylindrosporum]|uniref:Uncharacterized protein n=1 Tax=Hebeloma cylindrosporum TaxID=76867 RepID=A0A0C3CSV8_HEBCY|nr:hypothetical protein M413DRAFT_440662 [Hebeloma cylindrosporum h7]